MSKVALEHVAATAALCFQGPRAGSTAPLSSLWTTSTTPVVLVFLRRLGCALCRVYAQDVEALRVELGDKARVVCLSFERIGEGSDEPPVKGGSFTDGGYFKGEMFKVDQAAVYDPLFGRKGLMNGFGIGSLLTDKSGKMAQASQRGCVLAQMEPARFRFAHPPPHTHTHARATTQFSQLCRVTGNLKGDGMQLGGSFVVAPDGKILLEKRQKFFGDDASPDALRDAVLGASGAGGQ